MSLSPSSSRDGRSSLRGLRVLRVGAVMRLPQAAFAAGMVSELCGALLFQLPTRARGPSGARRLRCRREVSSCAQSQDRPRGSTFRASSKRMGAQLRCGVRSSEHMLCMPGFQLYVCVYER